MIEKTPILTAKPFVPSLSKHERLGLDKLRVNGILFCLKKFFFSPIQLRTYCNRRCGPRKTVIPGYFFLASSTNFMNLFTLSSPAYLPIFS